MSAGGDPSCVRGGGESGSSGDDDRRGTGGTAADGGGAAAAAGAAGAVAAAAGGGCGRFGAWGISGPTTGHSSGSKYIRASMATVWNLRWVNFGTSLVYFL